MLHLPPRSTRQARARFLLPCSAKGGFTLLEMLVVLIILAAVAALVVSNVDGTVENAEMVGAKATMQTVLEAFTGTPSAPGYLPDMKYVPGFRSVDIQIHDLFSDSRYPNADEFDRMAKRGWRGPYLRNAQSVANTNSNRNGRFPASHERRFPEDATFFDRNFFHNETESAYGKPGDVAVGDPWGNPIVLQIPPPGDFSGSVDTVNVKRFRHARLVSAGPDGVLTTPFDDPFAGMLSDGTAAVRGDDLVLFLNRADIHEPEE